MSKRRTSNGQDFVLEVSAGVVLRALIERFGAEDFNLVQYHETICQAHLSLRQGRAILELLTREGLIANGNWRFLLSPLARPWLEEQEKKQRASVGCDRSNN